MRKKLHGLNSEVRHPKVRIIGEGVESRECSSYEASKLAESMGVDLIEVNPNSTPPLVRLMRYDKFLYEEKKKTRLKEKKDREQRVEVKEIRLTPNTDKHDLDFKLKHSIEFLEKGDKVKVSIFFSGREIMYKDRGEVVLLEFAQSLQNHGTPEALPKLEGKRMFMMIKPIKK